MKIMINTESDSIDNIQTDGTEINKVTNYTYLGQTIVVGNRTRQTVSIKIKTGWTVFGKYREIFLDRHLTVSLERKTFNQCVLSAWHMDAKHGLLQKH